MCFVEDYHENYEERGPLCLPERTGSTERLEEKHRDIWSFYNYRGVSWENIFSWSKLEG